MLRPTRSASGAPYPLREKWVRDAVAYYLARDSPMRKYRLQHQTYPLLTKWVCARTRDAEAYLIFCRPQHHRPTSHEVGISEDLTRTR